VNKVQSHVRPPRTPLYARAIRYTFAPSHTREEPAKEPHGVRRASFFRPQHPRPSLSFSVSFPRAERPILISIMTRNGCWRECSSLSVAPVPVVYLSDTRTAPFHPGEKHGEAETAVSRLFFYVHVASFLATPLRPCLLPAFFSPTPISMPGKMPSRELRLITLFCITPEP